MDVIWTISFKISEGLGARKSSPVKVFRASKAHGPTRSKMDTRHVLAWVYHVFSVLEITVLKLTIPENPPTVGSFTLSSVQTREVKPFFKDY